MTLYQLLRKKYSDEQIKKQFLNSVITSTAIEGVDVSYLSQSLSSSESLEGREREE